MIPKKIQNTIWFNAVLLLVAVVLSLAAYRAVRQAVELGQEAEDGKKKINELAIKKQELETKIAELQTSEAQERLAKEKLNLKKNGEEVVVVVPDKNLSETKTTSNSWMIKVRDFLGSLFK